MTTPADHRNDNHGPDKNFTIVINGREKVIPNRELTYDQVIDLAYDTRPGGNDSLFTITYRRGEGNKPEGSLLPGETVRVKEGMIFNVTHTNRS